MLDAGGYVAEASGMNLFIARGKTLVTPPPYAGILRGVTRDVILELAPEAGYQAQETPINRYDIYTADEAFLTGTAAELIAIAKLDGRVIGAGTQGPIVRDLTARFRALTCRGS
jgi:branched-chain amino acid aminotransferase